jgi:uncharacterized protein
MGKILSWLLMAIAGYLVWRLVTVLKRKGQASVRGGPAGEAQGSGAGTGSGTGSGTGTGQRGKALADERIVPCAHCGVHIPASEAVEAGGRLYCCPAHRDADRPA